MGLIERRSAVTLNYSILTVQCHTYYIPILDNEASVSLRLKDTVFPPKNSISCFDCPIMTYVYTQVTKTSSGCIMGAKEETV